MRMNEIEEKANIIIKDRRKKVSVKVWITLTIIFISIIKSLRLDEIDNSLFNLFIILLLFGFFYVGNTLQNLVSDIFLINDEEYKLSKKIIKNYNRKVNEIKKKEKREKEETRKKEQEKLKEEEDEREELLNKIKIERSLFEAKRKSQSIQELRQYITDNIEKE
jgi:hypothetical protein